MIDDDVVVLDRKLPYEIKHTLAFTHRAMFLEGNINPNRLASWCIVFDHNVAVLDGKLPYES